MRKFLPVAALLLNACFTPPEKAEGLTSADVEEVNALLGEHMMHCREEIAGTYAGNFDEAEEAITYEIKKTLEAKGCSVGTVALNCHDEKTEMYRKTYGDALQYVNVFHNFSGPECSKK